MTAASNRHLGISACFAAILMLLAALAGGTAYGQGNGTDITVSNLVIRMPAATGRPGAGYLQLKGGAKPDRLVAASSPAADRIELHRMTTDGVVMKMERIEGIDIPANATVSLKPGGLHLMLFGLKPEAAQGAPVTLQFASGSRLTVQATAVAPGGSVHDSH